MTRIGIATVLLCCLLPTMASAGDSYLCVADMATGFKYNKALHKWESVNFNVDNHKYFVSRSKRENIGWEVKVIGEHEPFAICIKDFNDKGFLFCELSPLHIFNMNRINLRYISIDPLGYYWDNIKDDRDVLFNKEGEGSPLIEIGKCTPLP